MLTLTQVFTQANSSELLKLHNTLPQHWVVSTGLAHNDEW